jgi:Cu/Ag efflux pump CusA
MSTAERLPAVSPEVIAELQQAIDNAIKGVRDPVAMREAAERMDRMREMMPETTIAVELIREARDEE